MCPGDNCPIRESCYRYTALPHPYRQSYIDYKYDYENKFCEAYDKDDGSRATRKKKEESDDR
jgi:hypothetical protein